MGLQSGDHRFSLTDTYSWLGAIDGKSFNSLLIPWGTTFQLSTNTFTAFVHGFRSAWVRRRELIAA